MWMKHFVCQEIESISKDEPESAEGEGAAAEVETAAADSTSTPHASKQITPVTTSSEESEYEEKPPPDITKPAGTGRNSGVTYVLILHV